MATVGSIPNLISPVALRDAFLLGAVGETMHRCIRERCHSDWARGPVYEEAVNSFRTHWDDTEGRAGDDGARRDNAPPDWPALNAAARDQAKSPIRAGVPGFRPFWNAHAKAFIHPPAFDFADMEGAKGWRFELKPQDNPSSFVLRHSSFGPDGSAVWTAPHPWLPVPGDVWDSLAPGYYTLRAAALGADRTPLDAPASERRFYRAAVFHGPYPAGARDYREAAARVYASVYNLPHVQAWLESDDPPPGYDLYCYPAKILSSMIRALCRHAENLRKGKTHAEFAENAKSRALAIARKMADWLIAHSQPEGAPLAHFPPTYWGNRRDVAVNYAGQNMLGYPAHAAQAYFDLAEATGETKYRDAALAILRTYVRLQGDDGTWPLKVRESDGSPVRANRLLPGRYLLGAFDRGGADFAAARDRAFAFIEREPLTSWNWDGQFEDMDPMPLYQNLQKGVAVDTALRLFEMGRNAEALEIVDWCEDQFVVWSDPIHHMDWQHWKTPTALEQYDYYTPIDASMGDMIGAFAAAYRATGDRLYLEKARALADNITRNQRADGTIPTYFDSRGGSDWVNCMVYVADRLEYLSGIETATLCK